MPTENKLRAKIAMRTEVVFRILFFLWDWGLFCCCWHHIQYSGTRQNSVRFIFLKCCLNHFPPNIPKSWGSYHSPTGQSTSFYQCKGSPLTIWSPKEQWVALPVLPKQHSILDKLVSQVLPVSPNLTNSMSCSGHDPFS